MAGKRLLSKMMNEYGKSKSGSYSSKTNNKANKSHAKKKRPLSSMMEA